MKQRGELTKVGDLFSHYRTRIVAPQASVVAVVVEVIVDVCGITVTSDRIVYNVASRTLSLQLPSVIKHEIIRHKEEILLHCHGRLGARSAPKDII